MASHHYNNNNNNYFISTDNFLFNPFFNPFPLPDTPHVSDLVSGFRDFSVSDYHLSQTYAPMLPQNLVPKVEEAEVKVGRYSVEERKDRILRYLKKRNHRNFNKTIKYACRKTLADKRIRVRGRFAKNSEASEEVPINNGRDHSYELTNSFCKDSFQMKYEEDYWLQAAIDNLVHLPYL